MDKEPEDLEGYIKTKDQLDAFLEKIRQGSYIAGKTLNIELNNENIGLNDLKELVKAFSSGKMPPGSTIQLMWCSIDPGGAEIFATALQSGNWPSPSTLNLKCNPIGNEGAIILANAIQSGNCPSGLTIVVGAYQNELGDDGWQSHCFNFHIS